jgi:hypothetical protein
MCCFLFTIDRLEIVFFPLQSRYSIDAFMLHVLIHDIIAIWHTQKLTEYDAEKVMLALEP